MDKINTNDKLTFENQSGDGETEKINDNEPWNYRILFLLRKIGKKTMGYRWMHEQEAQYYDTMNTKMGVGEMIIYALLGTLTGASLANFIVNAGLQNNKILYIILTSFQLLILFVGMLIKGYRNVNKYEKQKEDHLYAALKNADINLNIQYQLSLNLKDRDNDKNFLNNTIKNFNDLLFLSPQIRESTRNKYMEETDDNDMFNPIISNPMDPLEIVIHDNKNDNKANGMDSNMKYQIDRWLRHF